MKKKEATEYGQQITRLRVRGFNINSNDENEVKTFLSNVGYYRTTGYILPYYNKKLEKLNDNMDFDKIMSTYWFDKELKSILLYLISLIEVEYKARIADTLCLKYGSYFYYDSKYFDNASLHDKWIKKFEEKLQYSDKNDELFKVWYKDNYDSKFPLWVAFQLININDLSKFYDMLKTKYKKELKNCFKGVDYPYTKSWLRSTTVVRNIAAHNGRLFYRTINTSPKLPQAIGNHSVNIKRLFVVIVALKELCTDDIIWNRFFSDLINLIIKFPSVDLIHYGFPRRWYEILAT